jgi:Family of unknown function (DUF6510)
MTSLDGNAVAGQLQDVFGADMTTAVGTCATCGAVGFVAEFEVYIRAPGAVVRCRACRSILVVLVSIRGVTCVDLRGLAVLERPR